jgi:predicted phage-related endonuclease
MEKQIETIEAEIKDFMGEEEKCICGDFEVDWKTTKRRTLDITTLRVEEPDTYNKYAVENVTRRFTVKKLN